MAIRLQRAKQVLSATQSRLELRFQTEGKRAPQGPAQGGAKHGVRAPCPWTWAEQARYCPGAHASPGLGRQRWASCNAARIRRPPDSDSASCIAKQSREPTALATKLAMTLSVDSCLGSPALAAAQLGSLRCSEAQHCARKLIRVLCGPAC